MKMTALTTSTLLSNATWYTRTRFNQGAQQQGETIKSFITALHWPVEHCENGTLHTQMIWDRLVVGLLDANLSELQSEADLKLEDAIAWACNSKAVKSQQIMVWSSSTSSMLVPVIIDVVQFHSKGKRPQWKARASTDLHSARKGQLSHPHPTHRCGWCSNDRHPGSVALPEVLNADNVLKLAIIHQFATPYHWRHVQ